MANNINHQVSCLLLTNKPRYVLTKKANSIILSLYVIATVFAGVGLAIQIIQFEFIAGLSVVLGLGLAVLSEKKPVGWFGMTKERII